MELLSRGFDILFHIDIHLSAIITSYGPWVYGLLFLIIFCETGLVVTPFLPGDSLLFAVGAFASKGMLCPWTIFILLVVAAIAGDSVNYWIGATFGVRAFGRANARVLNANALERTHAFYEKYGGKTIVLARFVPIIRTFAPFVAGIGKMRYSSFFRYNVVGGVVWVSFFIFLGYFFGNLPVVQENFSLAIIAVIIISLLPAIGEAVRHRREQEKV
ncbi:MAG: DedA family protein [Candidatus Ratteibacteria bacterium]|jgi:membrane-associated protein